MKAQLTTEQAEVLNQLIEMASIGCMRELSALNFHQCEVIKDLKKKGYVTLTKKKFMVILPPPDSN